MADDATFHKALQLEVRNRIYTIIDSSPGLHFREIQRRANLAVGSLQYHLDYLQKYHIIRTQKEGKFVRYYAVRNTGMGEGDAGKKTMAFLRHASTRKILLFLLQEKRANNETIATHIALSPSTTSWHLDKLVKENVLSRVRDGRKTFFAIVDPILAQRLVVDYQKSFLDDAVDNFVEMIVTLSPPDDTPSPTSTEHPIE
ncbi:MAG: winged helix-turn-helix transcriptional regulator [Candidatus Diapherotrites archaeon]|nr:winged helix-turn-helix transcriptional regulator [Candidatus Diapherotrites archaeon]MDZ4256327.1 winged helix-turn-helix transcriptional regulator [archaeon]